MKIQCKRVRVRGKDGFAIIPKTIPAWEVPVQEAANSETSVIADIVEERANLSVSAEYERLANCYGAERQEGGITGIPYVAAVYGQHGAGLAALRAAMQAAVLPSNTPVTPPPAPPVMNDKLHDAVMGDFLTEHGDSPTESDIIGEQIDA